MWNVRLYYNTGLNSVNIVDSPAILSKAQYIDLPALDILQGEGLETITVKATRAQVKRADFCVLTDTEGRDMFFYSVNAFMATSKDVQQLSVTLDALMTLEQMTAGVSGTGGRIDKIKFLDGIVERHHVAKKDDVYGAYTEDDPFLIPSKELEFDYSGPHFDGRSTSNSDHVIVESTISLDTQANNYSAITYTDAAKELDITVPTVVPVTENTKVYLGPTAYVSPGTEYFDYSYQKVQDGVKQVRSLGIESGIINSYTIPDAFCTYTPTSEGRILGLHSVQKETETFIKREYGTFNNMRLVYGNLNMIELISQACGTKTTFKPEDVFLNNETEKLDDYLKVQLFTDPRPGGRPYFAPLSYKSENPFYRWMNMLPGMEWSNAPLVYTGKSGSTLDQIEYNTTMSELLQNRYTSQMQNIIGTTMSNVGALSGVSGMNLEATHSASGYNLRSVAGRNAAKGVMRANDAAMTANARAAGTFFAGAAMDIAANEINYAMTDWALERSYNLTARRELQNLMIGNSVVKPDINFPRNETARDFLGNGVLVIRYRPSLDDCKKLDKILTMYGYKDTKSIEASDFTNRSKFNYVQARGVTIGGDYPKWLREAAAAQLAAGVRVWHQLPDVTAYTDGTNV